jgi:hypothetical protein
MSSVIVVRNIGFSQLLRTPKYRETSFSFNVERYTVSNLLDDLPVQRNTAFMIQADFRQNCRRGLVRLCVAVTGHGPHFYPLSDSLPDRFYYHSIYFI